MAKQPVPNGIDVASFQGTLAFARQALWMVFLLNLVCFASLGIEVCLGGIVLAILAACLSYLAQTWYTIGLDKHGRVLQYLALAAAALAVLVPVLLA